MTAYALCQHCEMRLPCERVEDFKLFLYGHRECKAAAAIAKKRSGLRSVPGPGPVP